MTRTVPVTSSQSPGAFITGALWNAGVKALGDFTLAQPVFVGYQTAAQSINSGAFTAVLIDTENLDSDGAHSNITNTSRFTPTVPGTYLLLGAAAFANNATGVRSSRFALNGTAIRGSQNNLPTTNGSVWAAPCFAVQPMNGTTDYAELQGFQNSGGALSTYNGTDCTSYFAAFWISQ